MRMIRVKELKNIPSEYNYQLTEFIPELWDILPAIMQFKKYNDIENAVLVSAPKGFAIFTKGQRRKEEKEQAKQEQETRNKIMRELVYEETVEISDGEITVHGTTEETTYI